MKQNARLKVFGYYGDPFPPAISYNLTAESLWKKTSATVPTLTNMVRLDAEGGSSPSARYPADVTGSAIMRLAHRRVFTEGPNTVANWDDVAGTAALHQLNAVGFGNGFPYLEHADATSERKSHYVSRGLALTNSRPFSVNGYIYEPDSDQTEMIWMLRSGRFQFQIHNGAAAGMWLASTWTEADEDTLHVLLAVERPTGDQQNQMDALKVSLYDTFESLDLGGAEYFTNGLWSLDFMPETFAGRVGVEAGNGKRAVLKIKRPDTDRGTPMPLWNEGRLHVRCNGGAYFWQVGFPQFTAAGEQVVIVKAPVTPDQLGAMYWTLNKEVPLGTSAEIVQRAGTGTYGMKLAVVLTSDGVSSPIIYAAAVHFEAGPRTGLDTVVWDSNNHLINGHAPFLDLVPCWDDNGRQSWEIKIPLLAGQILGDLPGFNYPYMEDRVATLEIDGTAVLTEGIIRGAKVSDMRAWTPNLPEVNVESAQSELTLTLADGWAMTEETALYSPPVGDYLRVGAYAKRILRACGFKAAQLATISDSAGQLIKGADQGEDWAELPAQYSAAATVLHSLEEKYGLGKRFRQHDDGNWYFERPSIDVAAVFTSETSSNSPLTTEGNKAVLQPIDWDRGCGDAYNVFIVTGAEDRNGDVVSAGYKDYASRLISNSPAALNYRGRWILCPPLNDPALRTRDACAIALRGLRELYQVTGRKGQFPTYFNLLLRPGALIDIDGRVCKILRCSGSWANDEMQVYVREVS